jgi:hypothetical protein
MDEQILNEAQITKAINDGTHATWSIQKLESALATMHRSYGNHHQAGYVLNNCETLRAQIKSIQSTNDKDVLLDELDQHHALHSRILNWSKVAAIAGVVVVVLEGINLASEKFSRDAKQSPNTTQQQQQLEPVVSNALPPKAATTSRSQPQQ